MPEITLKPVRDQVTVIFGASSGIGRATALKFAAAGAKTIVVARNEEALNSLVAEITASGGSALAIAADTTEYQAVKMVAEQTIQHFGRIDTWAHVAGVGIFAKFIDITPEEFHQVVHVNLMGQVYGAMVAIPYLRQNGGGALIHVSSILSQVGSPFQSAYAASKHGMKGFIDVMRVELAHDNMPISVTNIMPAAIDTPFYENARTKMGFLPRIVPPVYSPEKVADAILDAAQNPRRDVIVGGAGHFLVWANLLMPALMDKLMKHFGFRVQMSHQPKSGDASTNLFASETNDGRVSAGLA